MICFHKWGKVEEGYQYCGKCGEAKLAPCQHKWEEESEYKKTANGRVVCVGTVLQCSKCGDMKNFETTC